MSRNSIGGFFVDLGMNIDKNSFEAGNKYIDGIGNGFNRITGLARNAAVVLATTAIAGGTMSSAEIKVAEALGVATENLDKWKAAIRIAGGNVGGFVSELGQLSSVIAHAKYDAAGLEQLAKKLSFLKINVADLIELNPDEAYRQIIETAQKRIAEGEDPFIIYSKIKDVLGTSGQGFLIELQRRGMGVDEALGNASKTQFQTREGKNAGADFIAEVKTISSELASLTRAFGDELGGSLTPAVKSISKWLIDNGDEIMGALRTTILVMGDIGRAIKPFIDDTISNTKTMLTNVEKIVTSAKEGDYAGAAKTAVVDVAVDGIAAVAGMGIGRSAEETKEFYGERSELGKEVYREQSKTTDDQNWWEKTATKITAAGKGFYSFVTGKKVNDGIIRPNGQVTQVAQDDWVFAAKNVGDLARAFIPQGLPKMAGGNAQYSIVQNFTINGAKDTAQTLRQQAFNGTRSALVESMTQSGRRLQQMSGTR